MIHAEVFDYDIYSNNCFLSFKRPSLIDNIRFLTVGMEPACNQGPCGGISLKQIFAFENIPPHEPRLQASSILTVRIGILSTPPRISSKINNHSGPLIEMGRTMYSEQILN